MGVAVGICASHNTSGDSKVERVSKASEPNDRNTTENLQPQRRRQNEPEEMTASKRRRVDHIPSTLPSSLQYCSKDMNQLSESHSFSQFFRRRHTLPKARGIYVANDRGRRCADTGFRTKNLVQSYKPTTSHQIDNRNDDRNQYLNGNSKRQNESPSLDFKLIEQGGSTPDLLASTANDDVVSSNLNDSDKNDLLPASHCDSIACASSSKNHDANPQEDSPVSSALVARDPCEKMVVLCNENFTASNVRTRSEAYGGKSSLLNDSYEQHDASKNDVERTTDLSDGTKSDDNVSPVPCHENESILGTIVDVCQSSFNISLIKVGVRVEIYWDGEDRFFSGTVVEERPENEKAFLVEYDDGDREWINFNYERYRLLENQESLKCPEGEGLNPKSEASGVHLHENLEMDWVSAGISKSDSDSDTDEEELMEWAIKMFGIPQSIAIRKTPVVEVPVQRQEECLSEVKWGSSLKLASEFNNYVPISISEKVKLARRNRTTVSYAPISPPKKQVRSISKSKAKGKKSIVLQNEADAKLKKVQARPLTAAEIKSILEHDCPGAGCSSWVRRSVRQPSKSSLTAPRVKALLEKLSANDSDMVVLKMKKYCSDLDTPSIVIDAVLDALEENTNCEALYIQNFNEGMRDEQVLHLLKILQRPSCKIWCLNIGETYKVQMKTWEKFAKGLADTNITHMYASEHTITAELKEQIRETIRLNRRKHNRHDDPSNIDTIVQCTHCWWNPINAKSLRPYLQRKGYDHILKDAETQGLPGTKSGAFLS